MIVSISMVQIINQAQSVPPYYRRLDNTFCIPMVSSSNLSISDVSNQNNSNPTTSAYPSPEMKSQQVLVSRNDDNEENITNEKIGTEIKVLRNDDENSLKKPKKYIYPTVVVSKSSETTSGKILEENEKQSEHLHLLSSFATNSSRRQSTTANRICENIRNNDLSGAARIRHSIGEITCEGDYDHSYY
ncbi:hypothetical protein DICVIV_10615 [Dictyocaulus viviparus]|uniref:Uncharacterized protein n=1 Tax=Dictyocaulus viviparus TaxID=29172 RepID=A0A0D8XFK0_DICVI|nr:hypothetical protein DICVIV_10615 [Dictyocaulus viviparus]